MLLEIAHPIFYVHNMSISQDLNIIFIPSTNYEEAHSSFN